MDLLTIPEALAETLGISSELAGLIISVGIITSVAFFLAAARMNMIGIVSVLLSVLVLLVALQWTPYWVLILVALLIAGMFGKTMADWFTGKSSGSG